MNYLSLIILDVQKQTREVNGIIWGYIAVFFLIDYFFFFLNSFSLTAELSRKYREGGKKRRQPTLGKINCLKNKSQLPIHFWVWTNKWMSF